MGIGVLGKGLALCLTDRGYRVTAAHSKSHSSAQWLADRVPACRVYPSVQELCDTADLVFITTPDAVIGQIAASVTWRPGQAVVHCCGAASRELLHTAARQGAITGAFHPYQTFAGLESQEDIASRLSGVAFAVAGQEWLESYLCEMATELAATPAATQPEVVQVPVSEPVPSSDAEFAKLGVAAQKKLKLLRRLNPAKSEAELLAQIMSQQPQKQDGRSKRKWFQFK